MKSPNEYIRFNAAKSYIEVYPRASKKTAMTNGPRLKGKCRDRLLEIWEELLKRKGGCQLTNYHRGVKKQLKLNSSKENPKLSQPASIPASVQAQITFEGVPSKTYREPKQHQIYRDAINDSERDPWDSA